MKLEELNESVDPIAKKLKATKTDWKIGKNKDGETTFTTQDGDEAFQVYYNPTDTDAIGWAVGTVKKSGEYNWTGSGTDDIDEVIDHIKEWI